MGNYTDVVLFPYVQHRPVNDLGEGFLWIVGEGGTDGVWIGSAAPEPSLAAAQGRQITFGR